MKYRPGWTVFHLPSTPGAVQLARPALRRRRARRRWMSRRRVQAPCSRRWPSSTFPRRRRRVLECLLRLPPRAYLLAAEWQAHAQRRAVALPRRRLAALGLHPVALWVNRRRFDGLAAPTVAACLRHVPARRRHVLLELAWHGRCACVCLQYNGISAHYCNVPRQSEGSFAQAIDESLLRVDDAS